MSEKMSKQVEAQMAELNAKIDESNRTIQDLQSTKARMQNESTDLGRQLEDAESRISQFNKERQALQAQLDDARRSLEDETRVSYKSWHMKQLIYSKYLKTEAERAVSEPFTLYYFRLTCKSIKIEQLQ